MTLRKTFLTGVALLVPVAAYAAGYYTNGVPQVTAGGTYYASNGVCSTIANASTTCGNTYSNELGGYELIPADTQIGGGAAPQTVAPTTFQVGALASVMSASTNLATASGGAATLSTTYGIIKSEALTTAVGSSYTLTLTNTTVAATSKVQAGAYLGAGTQGALQIVSITPASGSVVIVIKNVGSLALNAAIEIPFQVS